MVWRSCVLGFVALDVGCAEMPAGQTDAEAGGAAGASAGSAGQVAGSGGSAGSAGASSGEIRFDAELPEGIVEACSGDADAGLRRWLSAPRLKALAVGDGYVYVSSDSLVMRLPLEGGCVSPVLASPGRVLALAVQRETLYVASQVAADARLDAVPVATLDRSTRIYDAQGTFSGVLEELAGDGASLFFPQGVGLVRADDPGQSATLARDSLGSVSSLSVSGSEVFWVASGRVYINDVDPPVYFGVSSVPTVGGEVTQVSTTACSSIAKDDAGLFCVHGSHIEDNRLVDNGDLVALAADGTPGTALATGMSFVALSPRFVFGIGTTRLVAFDRDDAGAATDLAFDRATDTNKLQPALAGDVAFFVEYSSAEQLFSLRSVEP